MPPLGRFSKKEIKPSPAQRIFEDVDTSKCYELFALHIQDESGEIKLPFYLTYEYNSSGGNFKRMILYELKRRLFIVMTINSSGQFRISNEVGQLKVKFDTHTYHLNTNSIVDKSADYNECTDENKVSFEFHFFNTIPNVPSYFNDKHYFLISSNFLYNRDQFYTIPGLGGALFKGIVSLTQRELKMPSQPKDNSVEFFTFERTYVVFVGENLSYGIPTRGNMKCKVDLNNDCLYCKDDEVSYYYKVGQGIMGIDGFEANTINILRFRVIVSGSTDEVIDVALSRLQGLFPESEGLDEIE